MVIFIKKFSYRDKKSGEKRYCYTVAELDEQTKRADTADLFTSLDFPDTDKLQFGDIIKVTMSCGRMINSKPYVSGIEFVESSPFFKSSLM